MLFNSLTFMIFLALFLLLWEQVKRSTPLRLWLILIASIIFYGWWDWRFLFLIFFTGSVDFFLALALEKASAVSDEKLRTWIRKGLLALSLICGIGVLSIFKYSGFFADQIAAFCALFGLKVNLRAYIPEFCLILPVGISFYTFQSLSYTIDVYRERLKPTRSIVHYFAYLMLFPQLVAGPIVRAVDLLPKLKLVPQVSPMIQYNALKLVALGFFKKCVLADNAANIVDTAFSAPSAYCGSWTWFLVMVMFSIQIYCDFSGYSDIARGIIKFMGYRFNLNFDHPYRACSLQDFWSRWHISLSSWFRDYVYIPLGGNRKGLIRTLLNLFITFLISGLWHGAALNFVIWGAFHGILQVVEKIFRIPAWVASQEKKWVIALMMILTQFEVLIGWIFFRAGSFAEAKYVLTRIFSFSRELVVFKPASKPLPVLILFLIMEVVLILKLDRKLLHKSVIFRRIEPLLIGLLMLATILYRGEGHGFIYFQF